MRTNKYEGSIVTRRQRPKVLLVSKKKSNQKQILPTEEELIRALDVNPSDRTQKDIDTILAIVGKWKDFQTFIKMDQEKKEIWNTTKKILSRKRIVPRNQIYIFQYER